MCFFVVVVVVVVLYFVCLFVFSVRIRMHHTVSNLPPCKLL